MGGFFAPEIKASLSIFVFASLFLGWRSRHILIHLLSWEKVVSVSGPVEFQIDESQLTRIYFKEK